MGLFYVTSTPRRGNLTAKPAYRALLAAGIACLAVAGMLSAATPARADQDASQASSPTSTVTLEILNANLLAVIDMLRQRSGAQFIVTGDPHSFRPVNVNVTAPLPQVLEYVAESAGAAVTVDSHGVYTIRPADMPAPASAESDQTQKSDAQTAQAAAPAAPPEPTYYEKIVLNYVEPSFIVAVLDGADPSTISPYRTPYPNSVAAAQYGIPVPSTPTPIQVLNYNPPAQTQGNGAPGTTAPGVPLANGVGTNTGNTANQFNPPPGTTANQNPFGAPPGGGAAAGGRQQGTLRPDGITQIVVITEQNALLVRGTSQGIGELRELISKLDVPAKQVQIKVEFVTASVNSIDQFGISFDLIPNPATETGFFGSGPSGAGSVFLNYAHGNIVTQLAALLTSSKGRVISAPILTLTNNIQGSVFVTVQIPYSQTTTVVPGNGTALQGSTTSFLSVPTGLSATARVNGDDSVTLRMAPQLSTVGAAPAGGGPPPVTSQTINTIRTVGNGETLVLGGLVQKTDTDSTQVVPFLGELPIIGNLFRTKDNNVSDSELLVFVTPTILPIPGSTTTGQTPAPTEGGFGVSP